MIWIVFLDRYVCLDFKKSSKTDESNNLEQTIEWFWQKMFSPVDTVYTDEPSPDFPERLQNELLTVPHKAERPDDVAHTEQVDPSGAG